MTKHPPPPRPPDAEAWHRQVRERERAANAALVTVRPVKPAPPWFWQSDRELGYIVGHVPRGRGRASRAVALWSAFCAVANQSRGSSFIVRRSALAKLSGLSVEAMVETLKDLDRIAMIERIGQPTPMGQRYALHTPVPSGPE